MLPCFVSDSGDERVRIEQGHGHMVCLDASSGHAIARS